MKKWLLILGFSLASYSFSFGQDNNEETYFHELRGMEGSTGTTHLFYRLYEEISFQCSEESGGQTLTSTYDHVSHFNTESLADSVKFRDFYEPWCIDGIYDSNTVIEYTFFDQNPEYWITRDSGECYHGIRFFDGNYFSLLYGCITKQLPKKRSQHNFSDDLLLSPKGDSIYVNLHNNITLPLSGVPEQWPDLDENDYEGFEMLKDSIGIDQIILDIHTDIYSLYFAGGSDGSLYRSESYSQDFELVESKGNFRSFAFAPDSMHIYSLQSNTLARSADLGKAGSWEFIELDFSSDAQKYMAVDQSVAGQLFLSDSTTVLYSDNHGDSFSTFTTVDHKITGLYKKPYSDILYVLTKQELLEVNTETDESTSLKQLPVSNELVPDHTDLPYSIELHQNFPNPFNPVTVIGYQLPENRNVTLEVFDITGRRVAVLVDKLQSAGEHQVTFDASSLSSGVYLYRLTTGEHIRTRKMVLVK